MTTSRIQTRLFSSENEVDVVGHFLNKNDVVDYPYVLKRRLPVSFWRVFWKIHLIVNG